MAFEDSNEQNTSELAFDPEAAPGDSAAASSCPSAEEEAAVGAGFETSLGSDGGSDSVAALVSAPVPAAAPDDPASSAPALSDTVPEVKKRPFSRKDAEGRIDLMNDFRERDNDNRNNSKGRTAWGNLTFKTQLALAFSFIAAITVLVAILIVSVVWEQYFRAYTSENMQNLAQVTAEQIAKQYEESDDFDSSATQPASNAVALTKGVGMQVLNSDGQSVYDSTTIADAQGLISPSIAPLGGADNVAEATVMHDGEQVGTVRVWVYGSNQLLREGDEEFRAKSYQAMIIASIVAIFLASIFGYFYATRIVHPIKRVTDVAVSVREGDLTARVNLPGDDEIARLGQTFDSMVSAIERDRKLERRLTTDVAHELRTPLMAIQATVEAMVDGVLPMDEERLMTVDSEVMRLSRLVDSLLKLSRLENRSNPMKKELVDVGAVVGDIIATHEAYVQEAGLDLSYEADPNVIVLGDPDMIRQATANLISNAVRYTEEGGSIAVTVRRNQNMASISVCDTGIGLSPEEARMVFERFWRADKGRAREKGGLGVGLTVVKEIVERHHGWVQVEGVKGEGACFIIHIPLYQEKNQRNRNNRSGHNQRHLKLPQIYMK